MGGAVIREQVVMTLARQVLELHRKALKYKIGSYHSPQLELHFVNYPKIVK